jgi:hypothetical protein
MLLLYYSLTDHVLVNPRQYAEHVNSYAALSSTKSLYPGSNFESLASFLQQAYRRHPGEHDLSKGKAPTLQEHPFLVHYNLKDSAAGRTKEFTSAQDLLEYTDHNIREPDSANLLFLRGYPSPEWLNVIGSKFMIDPEFFRRHLDFQREPTTSPDFSLPPLPSATFHMTRLRISTVASRMDNKPVTNKRFQEDLDKLREETKKCFHKYLETLRHGSKVDVSIGDSVVRAFSVLNHEYTAIEQDVSIYIEQLERGIFGKSTVRYIQVFSCLTVLSQLLLGLILPETCSRLRRGRGTLAVSSLQGGL